MNKRIGVFILCIGLCLSLCGCAAAVLSEVAKTDATDESSAPTSSQDVVQTKDSYAVGEQAELDGVTVTLTQVEESQGKEYFRPADGKVFLLCHFEIANDSEEDIAVSSMMSFDTYVDDYAVSMSLNATVAADAAQMDGTVAAGKKLAGVIGYEVDANWSELEISFTPDVWSDKNLTFVASRQG